jgi:multicomponent Na+:H+ antiporter subunit G
MSIVVYVLVTAGILFLAISALGLFRLPDLYTRGHAVAKSETLGLLLIFGGLFFHPALSPEAAIRLVFVLAFALIANPTAVHALIRAARRSGQQPWTVRGREDAP